MKNAIYRTQCGDERFQAPRNVTFGYQVERRAFSVWHLAGDRATDTYVVVGTGHDFEAGDEPELVASVETDDGWTGPTMFHLVRVKRGQE
jgi:hypothetical protein